MEDHIGKILIAMVLGLGTLMLIAMDADIDKEKEMVAKCTPDPTLFECQLYLAKKCESHNSSQMATGLATGLIIGHTTARN